MSSKQINLLVFGVAGVLCVAMAVILMFASGGGGSSAPPAAESAASAPAAAEPASAEQAVAAPIDQPALTAESAAQPAAPTEPSAVPLPSEIANLELPAEQVADVRQKLRQIGLALMNYESARNAFPPGKQPADRPTQLSWRVHILPFMDQGPLFKRFKLDEPWDSAHNSALLEFMPDIYRTGDDKGTDSRFAVLSGEQTMFPPGGLATHASCRDGASNTLLAVHVGGGKSVPWTKPEEVSFEAASPWRDLGMINGRLEGVLVDGQTISAPFEVGADTIVALATARGNEIVDGQGLRRRYSPDQGAAPQPGQVQREAMNRLKEVAMASLTFESARQSFPAAAFFREREGIRSPEVSWRVQLLPYMEQQSLFGRYQMEEPWDGAANQELLAHMPGVYRHEASKDDSQTRLQALMGEGTPFYFKDAAADERGNARGPVMRRLVDGSSNTIMFVESGSDRAVPWTEPRDLPFDPATPVESLGDLDPTGTYAVMFDGSVRVIAPDIDPEAFKSLALSDDRGAAAVAERRNAIRVPSADAAPSESPPMSDESSASVASAPSAGLKLFQLPRPAFHAAYDETTGHLMAAEEEQSQATLYEVGETIRELSVMPAPAKPCVVLCKRYKGASYFLVGGMLDRRIDVFQAADGKRTASITIGTPCIQALAAGLNDADPYVYYESNLEGEGYGYVGRLNLATMEDEGYISRGSGLTVSADGKLIYLEFSEGPDYSSFRVVNRPADSPPSVQLKICPVGLELAQQSKDPLQEEYVAHPDCVVVASGEMIRNYWLASYAGRLEFPVWAFWPKTPWAFGLNGRDLAVASLNDSRTVTTLPLPDGFSGSETRKARMEDELKQRYTSYSQVTPIFVDSQRRRLLIASGDQVGVFPLDQLNLPDEPLVAVNAPPTGTFAVGRTYEWPIAPFDSRISYNVLNAPDSVKFKQGAGLTVKTTDRDVGIQEIVVEAKFDRFKREQLLLLDVRRPSLPIPLDEMEVALSSDGATAVAWGLPIDAVGASESERQAPNLFVVDVKGRQLRARQRIPDGVRSACISGDHVYVLAGRGDRRPEQGAGELLQLGTGDLKLVKKLPVAGEPSLALAAEKYLLAGREIYEIPALTKLAGPPEVEGGNQQLIGQARWLAPGWNFGAAIWNVEADKAVMLVNPPGFIGSIDADTYRAYSEAYRQDHRMLSNWGRLVGLNRVDAPERNLTGNNASDGFRGLTVPGELPAMLELYAEQHQSADRKSGIRVREMISGTATQEIVLGRRPLELHSKDSYSGSTIAVAGPVIAAAIDRQLYFVSTDSIDKNHLQPPFRIELAQDSMSVSGRGQATLKYDLLEGESPYELKVMINGAELRASGKRSVSVSLDVQDMTARVLPTLAAQRWPGTKPEQDPRERVVDYVDAVTPYFKWLMGREPKGVPILLNAEVEATDRGLNVAKLPHSYFLELPEATVVKTLVDAANGKVTPYVPKEPAANPRKNDPERKRRLAELDQQLVEDYSEGLRKKFPSAAIDDKVLERRAKRSVAAVDAQLNNRLAEAAAGRSQNYRTWRDKKGHSTKAQLKSVFGDEVVLQTASGNEVKIAIDKFSPEDVEFIEASGKPTTLSRTARTVVQMQMLLQALQKHAGRTGSYPPGYLVAPSGELTLSWRVAILPDLGANDLFRMFHFDETWESEHNRKLLAYMPAVFRSTDSEAPADRTVFLGLRGTNGILSTNRSIGVSDVRRSLEPPIVLVEAAADGGLEWTRPRELESFQQGAMEASLRLRDGQFLVGSADGALRTVPVGTPEIAWQKAINHSDNAPSQIEFGDPLTLNGTAEE